jgi:esterase/lipase superfamily enzyme
MGKSNFVMSVRNIENGKFGDEPGEATYLEVPDGQEPQPIAEQKLSKDEWINKVIERAATGTHPDDSKSAVAGYTTGDILFFVHGYNNSMKAVMHRHNLLQKRLNKHHYRGVIVSFDWPSAEATLNYLEDRSDARATAHQLVKGGIRELAHKQLVQDEYNCDIDVHLLGHSTGAYVIREAFYEASHNRGVSRINWHVSQTAFIGGDIARKSLSRDDSKSRGLFEHVSRITNYQNPFDSALQISNIKRLNTAPRIGRVGVPEDAPGNIVNVNVGEHWETLDKKKSEAKGNWSHSWHFDDDLFAEDLALTLSGHVDRNMLHTRTMVDGQLILRKRAITKPAKKKTAKK